MLTDLRYAVRMLRKNPGFVAVAVCSLAIGIGANSAIYSMADSLLLRPLSVPRPSRVITVNQVSASMFGAHSELSYPDYIDLRDRNRTFDGLVAWSYAQFGFAPDRLTQPRMKFGMFVSGNFFKVLGVEPTIGRGFRADEDQAAGRDAVVVLSHELWVGEFESSPAAIGRKIRLNGIEFTIVGVAPETFPGLGQIKPALYTPVSMASKLWSPANLTRRDLRWLSLKGRLKPDVELPQAQADVASIATALRQMYAKTDEDLQLKAETEFQLRIERSPPDTALIMMLSLLAVCVLLVACANVAGLLLSRSTARAREIAVRLAIGSSRWSLIRQLLIENLLLAMGGAAAGLTIAYGAVAFFNTLKLPTDVPLDLGFKLDERALLFTMLIGLLSTFLFGLVPALKTTRLDLISALKERDGTASRSSRLWGRNAIVSGQVALSLVLLIVSGVLLDGFRTILNQGPGFRIDHLQAMSFDPGLVHYSDSQRELFYKRLLEDAKLAPQVQSAALTSALPLSMEPGDMTGVLPENRQLKRGERLPDVFNSRVTPGYFETMQIPILKGRGFLESDKPDTPRVAVVNEMFARHYWPKESAIGKRFRLNDVSGPLVQVVGVARISKYLWISEAPVDFVYLPFSQNPRPNMVLISESRNADAASLVPILRQVVQGLDRNMPIYNIRTMESLYENRAVATPNLITRTVAAMGMMGLILSVVGLYGVISYSVSRRTREFGIRMAVGADRQSVVRMVLNQGLILGAAGLTIGLLLGVLATRAITSLMLFSFGKTSVIPFVAVSFLLLATMMVAAYAPARRASRVDPMRALRDE